MEYWRFSLKIVTFFLSCFIITVLSAKTTTYDYRFGNAKIIDKNFFQSIELDGLPQSIDPLKPILPFQLIKILLPYGSKFVNLEVNRSEEEELLSVKNLELAHPQTPYSMSKALLNEEVDFSTFETNNDYPTPTTFFSVQKYHGYNVLIAKIHPVYITPDRRIILSHRINVKIKYQANGEESFIYNTNLLNHTQEISSFVDSLSQKELPSYTKNLGQFVTARENPKHYDYLIVTSSKLISYTGPNSLNDFKNFLEGTRHLKIKIVDEKAVESNQVGKDRAEKLRNFLKNEYVQFNPKYLLLVGDTSEIGGTIPLRRFYGKVKAYTGKWKVVEESIATDFYYSCLDGSFNSNNNRVWGENTDGENGNDLDFLCELTVGRWPVQNSSELSNIVKKTLLGYQLQNRSKNVLLLGEELFAELKLTGGDYMDKLIGTITDHGFTTKGFDENWMISKLYDTNSSSWSSTQAKKSINQNNFLFINHLGHSSTNYNMRMYPSTSTLSNSLPFFYYTQGCFPGYFVGSGNFVQSWINAANGPFAAIANSNYGLGPEDPDYDASNTPGTSQILNRFFVDRVLSKEFNLAFGAAHQKSKEDLLIYIDHNEARWVMWEATFFGDPALSL